MEEIKNTSSIRIIRTKIQIKISPKTNIKSIDNDTIK